MADLSDRLRAEVPAEAGFDVAEVNRRADRMLRRRRVAGGAALALVALAVVAVAGLGFLQPADDGVLLDGDQRVLHPASEPGRGPAALEAFDSPPLTAAEREAYGGLPAGTRLVRQVDSVDVLIVPGSSGGFCLTLVPVGGSPGEFDPARAADPFADCEVLPTSTGIFVQDQGVVAWLVPDGYDTATLDDGRQLAVVHGVATMSAQPTDEAQRRVVFTGDAGTLEWSSGTAPLAGVDALGDNAVAGLGDGLPSPDAQDISSVTQLFQSPVIYWLRRADASQAKLVRRDEAHEIWVAPQLEGSGICLLVVGPSGDHGNLAPGSLGLDCGPREQASRWPVVAGVRDDAGTWVGVVARGWEQLVLTDGTTVDIIDGVVVLPSSLTPTETATLVAGDFEIPVALAAAVDAASQNVPILDDLLSDDAVTYSVFDEPLAVDDPRLVGFLDQLDVRYPAQADPASAPDPATARLAAETDQGAVFVTRARTGEQICLIATAGSLGGCRPPVADITDPLPQFGFSGGDGIVRVTELIPDGYDRFELDSGSTIRIPHNVLVLQAPSPDALSGTLSGPAGRVHIEFGMDDPTVVGPGAVAQLADVCSPDLPTSPTADTLVATETVRPMVTVPDPPEGFTVLEPDGTGVASSYEPASAWTAFTTVGMSGFLGDGPTLAESTRIATITVLTAPLAADCLTMQIAIDQRDGQVITLDRPDGPVTAVAVGSGFPLVVFIDQTSDGQIQVLGDGNATLNDLLAAAEAVEIR